MARHGHLFIGGSLIGFLFVNLMLAIQTSIPSLNVISVDCGTHPALGNNTRGFPSQVLSDTIICVPWDIQVDEWWIDHPEYEEGNHNGTHQCFNRLTNGFQIAEYYQIHQVQFHSDCRNDISVRPMWSSGWEADFLNVVNGLLLAVKNKVPVQMSVGDKWWHYAAIKQTGENATCAQKDMSCYFLPLSRCEAKGEIDQGEIFPVDDHERRWVTDFITRSQQWLRRRVYDYLKEKGPKISGRCSVIHVRRSDVVLHEEVSRKYFPISDYIDRLPPERREKGANVVLLTDDANAVDEALEFFPELHWHYLDRPRHRGTEGGPENQVPSKDPALEVVIIKAILRMVQPCDVIVHGHGRFSNAIHDAMAKLHGVLRLRVEGNVTDGRAIFNETNIHSKNNLEKLLEEKRKKAQTTE